MKHKIFFKASTTISALIVALVGLGVVLGGCPAMTSTPDDNTGDGPGGGGPTAYRYACTNGTGADATFDARAAGIEQCASCESERGYVLTDESTCVRGQAYACDNGTGATDASFDAAAAGIERCASCNTAGGFMLQSERCVSLIGTWRVNGSTRSETFTFTATKITFSFIFEGSTGSITCDYAVSGSMLTYTNCMGSGNLVSPATFTINGNVLTLVFGGNTSHSTRQP